MSEVHDWDEDLEPWITNWEQQCIEEVERSPDLEAQIHNEKDCSAQELWLLFQNAATSIAQLYKDRLQGCSLWVPFQNAASGVTSLYKECVESQKRFAELGFQCGFQRRNKDLLAWAKKRKRNIRREDLIAFLTGKNPPSSHKPWGSPRQRLSLEGMRSPPHSRLSINASDAIPVGTVPSNEANLETFRTALALQGINGSVASGVSFRQHPSSSPSSHQGRALRVRMQSNPSSELNAFIAEEFARHVESRKRTSSPDVIMDSPTHKRSRLV